MAKRTGRHIGDAQLVHGMPKHMVGSVSTGNSSKSKSSGVEGESKSYWTVHPKPAACDKCQAMGGIKFAEKPERPHPNCKCEMKKHEAASINSERVDCSHLMEISLPGLGTTLLDRDFVKRVQAWRELNSKSGISLTFNEGFRTTKDQEDMGKRDDVYKPAKAGTSLHEAGRAVDVSGTAKLKARGLLSLVVENASSVGILWGGTFGDPPHFYREVPGGRSNRSKYIQRAQICARQE